jgi:hypothetical protein
MNSKISTTVIACLVALGGAFTLANCASANAASKEATLSAAGFRVFTPQTARQQELYAGAPSYKVQRGNANGKVFYFYKDEDKGVAYVGGEAEYQRYQQISIQKRIAQDNYMAAQMNQQSAYGWYGAWGPRYFWW